MGCLPNKLIAAKAIMKESILKTSSKIRQAALGSGGCSRQNANVQSHDGYKLVKLATGVHSVHSLAYRETFHPVIGPVAEAEALYVNQLQLLARLERHSGEFVIWDVGLGAAANALTVLRRSKTVPCPVRLV